MSDPILATGIHSRERPMPLWGSATPDGMTVFDEDIYTAAHQYPDPVLALLDAVYAAHHDLYGVLEPPTLWEHVLTSLRLGASGVGADSPCLRCEGGSL